MTDRLGRLTERERQCLRLVHAHFSSKQIARELGIKPGTVDRHCENAVRKLEVESRVAAALALVSKDGDRIGNDFQCDPAPMAGRRANWLHRVAERTHDDAPERYDTHRELARAGGDFSSARYDRAEKNDGSTLDRRDTQTGAVYDFGRRDDGAGLHRGRDAGRQLPAGHEEFGRFRSILVVFGVAAAAAWILTAAAGAERFAFVLQHLRYGG